MKATKKRLGWVVAMLVSGALLAGCPSDEANGGACIKSCIFGCALFCQNFTSSDGQELCTSGGGGWTPGQTCSEMGYTQSCSGTSTFGRWRAVPDVRGSCGRALSGGLAVEVRKQ